MYRPTAFRLDDPALAVEIMRAHPFATVVSLREGEPFASPLPLLYADGALWGHTARANPHGRSLDGARVLVLFHGPHAYVSPRWYADPADNVPTWNYVTVQVHGVARVLDRDATRDVLVRLVAQEEARFEAPWQVAPAVLDELIDGVTGFRVDIDRIEAKGKLSQNRAPADAEGARRGLAAGGPEERAVAQWMARVGRGS